MREAGWSRQQPIERASQRNEEAIKQWSEERWPPLKKAEQDKATIVWVDEAGFYSCQWRCARGHHVGRRHAAGAVDARSPLGHQRHHLDGRLFMQVRPDLL